MPVVLRYKGYRFFFFSNEGFPLEPLHVHVRKGESIAKFWMLPAVSIASAFGFSSKELQELTKVATLNRKLIERCWHDYFSE